MSPGTLPLLFVDNSVELGDGVEIVLGTNIFFCFVGVGMALCLKSDPS